MPGGFQSSTYSQPAIGVAGDFASQNPISTFDAGPFGLVAGSAGVTVGQFAWVTAPLDPNNGPSIVNSFGTGNVGGFVPRAQQGLNATYLSYATQTIPAGFPLSLITGGDVIAVNSGSAQALRGMKAYANFGTGAISFAASGSPTTTNTASNTITTGTAATFTGSISGNILTATSVTNTIYPGALLTGGTVATNTSVLAQITGTTGGAGTYYVDIPEQTVASASLTATPYVLATYTATAAVGGVITSQTGGTASGTVIDMSIAAVYGTNSYSLLRAPFVAPGTLTSATVYVSSTIETPWYALHSAANGEHVKMSAPVAGYGSQLS